MLFCNSLMKAKSEVIQLAKKKTYSETMIEAFLKYDKIVDIMKATNLSRGTIDKYRKDEEFQRVLPERKAIFVEAAVTKMQASLSEGADTLQRIINNENVPPQVRVNAIQVLFSQCRSWTETADILKRLEALEQAEE